MRVLIDTNIFIYREDPAILPEHLQKLLRITRENKHIIIVHPASIKDIENDPDLERRRIMISKLIGSLERVGQIYPLQVFHLFQM
jgi:predicted nucleic acid-binding protein